MLLKPFTFISDKTAFHPCEELPLPSTSRNRKDELASDLIASARGAAFPENKKEKEKERNPCDRRPAPEKKKCSFKGQRSEKHSSLAKIKTTLLLPSAAAAFVKGQEKEKMKRHAEEHSRE